MTPTPNNSSTTLVFEQIEAHQIRVGDIIAEIDHLFVLSTIEMLEVEWRKVDEVAIVHDTVYVSGTVVYSHIHELMFSLDYVPDFRFARKVV